MTTAPAIRTASRPATLDHRAVAGVAAVLLGAFLSSFSGRLDSVALADLRGAVGAGVDEAAWIPTVFGATQMLVAPIAIWLARIVSINRLLIAGLLLFATSQALMVVANTPGAVLALQVVAGLGSGVFFPVTIGYIVTVLPRGFVPFGLAAYALNLGLSINVAATLEGWFDAVGDWRWIFALNVVLALVAVVLVHVAIPRPPVDRATARNVDVVGLTVAPTALAMLYVALDQGERVDWLNSDWLPWVVIGACVLLSIFALHKGMTRRTGFDLALLGRRNIAAVLLVLATSRSLIAANALLVQSFLATVANHRPLQYGNVFLWLLLPQLLLAPVMARVLPRVNARMGMAVGVSIIVGGFVALRPITSVWHEADFIGSQVLQGVGQTVLLTSTLWFAIQHFKPADAMTFGAFLQIARLFGGEIGNAAFMAAVRHGEHTASNVVGQHLSSSDPATLERLGSLGAGLTQRLGELDAPAAALTILAQGVHAQAVTLATLNTVYICIAVGVAEVTLIALLRRPPANV